MKHEPGHIYIDRESSLIYMVVSDPTEISELRAMYLTNGRISTIGINNFIPEQEVCDLSNNGIDLDGIIRYLICGEENEV